jgi:hypothetical protein
MYDLIVAALIATVVAMWFMFGMALGDLRRQSDTLGAAMLFTGAASFTYGAIWFANWLKGVM